jgi:hypothetical protein
MTMSPWLDTKIALFHSAMDATPAKTVTVGAILQAIQTGAYRHNIERLRHLCATRGKDAYNAAKARLDAVTFCGNFAPTRTKANLVQHSGLIHGDLDHLPDVPTMKQTLCADAHTAYCFISPSGDGLKLGVCVAPVADDAAYKQTWHAVADYYQQRYGVTWDPSGKDISRLCFVSLDPALFVNVAVQPFPIPPPPAEAPRPLVVPSLRHLIPGDRREYYARQVLDTATKLLDASTPGNRHYWRRKAAYLLGGYVSGGILSASEAQEALEAAVTRNTAQKARAMKTIAACFEAGKKVPITPAVLERAHREWLAAHGYVPRRAPGCTSPYQRGVFARLRRW